MKKNIAYYLEDPERLSEISLHELNKWVEEMPYSQPLRLLVDMKSEKFVTKTSDNNSSYGVYFAQDYEPLTRKETKNLAEKNIEKVEIEDKAVPIVSVSEEGVAVEDKEMGFTDIKGSETSEIDTAPVIAHSLVDDVSEDVLEDDLLEINPNVVLVNEVSHEAADEVLEDELENEVLELSLEEVEEVSSFAVLDNLLNGDDDQPGADDETGDCSENDTDKNIKTDKYAGLVDYKTFVVGVSDDELKGSKIADNNEVSDVSELINAGDISKIDVEEPNTKLSTDESGVLVDRSKKVKKKKSKKKAKETVQVNKKRKAAKKKNKLKEKNKKEKINARNLAGNKEIKAKINKKHREEKSESSDNDAGSIKNVKGEVLQQDSPLKSKSVKRKAKKRKEKIKYVVVNEATTNDFKLKDYDGVSNFANWLLDQKSINGNLRIEEKLPEALSKKKKSKNKKKRKKNKVLKVAQDSVKKSEMILSEPLANIMAAQGHTKKAKKMYKQLGLIFPEKSSYFASKIENLKKK